MKRRSGEDRILTIPNILSLIRLLGVWFVFNSILDQHWTRSFVLFAIVSGTDWIDGTVARALNQRSRLGVMLDPVVDRILLIGTSGALLVAGPVWLRLALLPILLREACMTYMVVRRRFVLKLPDLPVGLLGKRAMFAVCAAIGSFVLFLGTGSIVLLGIGIVSYVVGLSLSYASWRTYAAKNAADRLSIAIVIS